MGKTVPERCGVPQCKTYRKPGISMHRLPKQILNNATELAKWKIILKMEKPFPKNFLICSLHFKKKYLLTPWNKNKKLVKTKLLESAFPTENLPKYSISNNKCVDKIKARYIRGEAGDLKKRCLLSINHCMQDSLNENLEDCALQNIKQKVDSATQTTVMSCEKGVQVSEDLEYNELPFKIDFDTDLNSMTGIPTKELLETIVNCCAVIRPVEKANMVMPLKNRIVLTMFRIKTNFSNIQTAILFKISQKTARFYFTDVVQLLAKAMKSEIYWQTREERNRLIAAARVHVEKQISRIKMFKMLSDKNSLSILPYVDDIRTIVCALSNLSSPF